MAELRLERLGPGRTALLRAVVAAAPGIEPIVVGGIVRDAVLGRRPARPVVDLDIAVPRGALDVARRVADRLGAALVPLDLARGVARVIAEGVRLDVTDFRGPTLEADLAARDFTVNALGVPARGLLAHGRARIVDPVGGLADLRRRQLRLPDAGVLDDDPLRGLRGVRLEATLGLRLIPSAARAIRARAGALATVSAERVRDELLLLLAHARCGRAVRRLDQLALLAVILPEIEPMRRTPQPVPHRYDVLEHSLRALEGLDRVLARPEALRPFGEELRTHVARPLGGGVARAHVLRLAALLHDVAKPETRRVIEGRVRFVEHDTRGAARVVAIGDRLRLPGRAVGVLERLVRHHLRPMHLAAAGPVTARARYRFFRDLGEDARDLLLLALVDAAAVRGESPVAVWRRAALIRDLLGGFAEAQAASAAPPLLRGEDVMERLGLRPGPRVGRLLERVREARTLGLVHTREDALRFLDSVSDAP